MAFLELLDWGNFLKSVQPVGCEEADGEYIAVVVADSIIANKNNFNLVEKVLILLTSLIYVKNNF